MSILNFTQYQKAVNEAKAPEWKVGKTYQDGKVKKVDQLAKDKVKVTFTSGDAYVYQIDRYNPENWVQVDEAAINEAKGDATKTVNDAINSGDHINNVSYEEYLLPLAGYLDTYADRRMGDLEFSKKTFTAFYNLVQSMNADMKDATKYQ